MSDATGDAGSKAPAYADLIEVTVESDGTNARVTVTMNGDVPSPMPSGEEMAIGVDIFRTENQREGDYQLYGSGDQNGWVAFLDTPRGFVKYPGTFQIGGPALVFTVPWFSLGSLRSAYARVFMDWDRNGVVLNDVGEDHAPDGGTFRYR
ncbi:MAG: hypothetical protein ABR548_09205 [Actinomycetota bacterium]|nr:hypothetical protein [Actinomycetota bacterium]